MWGCGGSISRLLLCGRRLTEEEDGLAVLAQGITPVSPSMAAREARLRPFGPANAH